MERAHSEIGAPVGADPLYCYTSTPDYNYILFFI